MIIGFHPGAGGNKLYRHLTGKEWETFNQSYDDQVLDQAFSYRYPTVESSLDDRATILTHCINTSLLKQLWPGHDVIIIQGNLQTCLRREWKLTGHDRYTKKIQQQRHLEQKLDLYKNIQDPSWPQVESINDLEKLPYNIQLEILKHWVDPDVEVSDSVTELKQRYLGEIDSAIAQIEWHKDYYTKYPMDLSACDRCYNIDVDDDTFSEHMRFELDLYKDDVFDQCWEIVYK